MPNYPAYKNYPKRGNSAKKLEPTTADIEGPFYKAGAPMRPVGDSLTPSGVQPDMSLGGKIMSQDGNPVLGCTLDIWQADAAGEYDNAGFKYRGKIESVYLDDRGTVYSFQTIRPGDYKISEPGEPDDFRCAHIHFKVTAPGYRPLTTQLYFPDDLYNKTDHWFSKDRVICDGRFDFVLEKE